MFIQITPANDLKINEAECRRKEKIRAAGRLQKCNTIFLALLVSTCFLVGMTKRKLNVWLLRKIQKHILKEPRRFYMDGLINRQKGDTKYMADDGTLVSYPPCGTVACIAGWANLLNNPRSTAGVEHAARLIGIPATEEWLDRLFFVFGWPKQFRNRYNTANSSTRRAKVAAARIEHLIKTGE